MADRKSPSESATLYKVGTKKKGNDGNTWIIETNKNGVKRWVKFASKPAKKNISVLSLYDIPQIKKYNWTKLLENLSANEKKFIEKVRSSYKNIQKDTGIKVVECVLPLSYSGNYFIDYAWDYAKEKYPDMHEKSLPMIIVVIKLYQDMHVNINMNDKKMIYCQHFNINGVYKTKFMDYMESFNKTNNGKIVWSGQESKSICFEM